MIDDTQDEKEEIDIVRSASMKHGRLRPLLQSIEEKAREHARSPASNPPLTLREITILIAIKSAL